MPSRSRTTRGDSGRKEAWREEQESSPRSGSSSSIHRAPRAQEAAVSASKNRCQGKVLGPGACQLAGICEGSGKEQRQWRTPAVLGCRSGLGTVGANLRLATAPRQGSQVVLCSSMSHLCVATRSRRRSCSWYNPKGYGPRDCGRAVVPALPYHFLMWSPRKCCFPVDLSLSS